MKRLALFLLLVATTAALAQAPVRVRGTITALSGDVLQVKSRDGKDLKIQLAPDVGVSSAKSTTLANLKGKYVGATSMNKDGKLVAQRISVSKDGVKPPH